MTSPRMIAKICQSLQATQVGCRALRYHYSMVGDVQITTLRGISDIACGDGRRGSGHSVPLQRSFDKLWSRNFGNRLLSPSHSRRSCMPRTAAQVAIGVSHFQRNASHDRCWTGLWRPGPCVGRTVAAGRQRCTARSSSSSGGRIVRDFGECCEM